MDNMINYFVILLFLILGVQIFRGKWLFLIAGFNMSSAKEKSAINIPVMSKIVGTFALSVAFLQCIDLFLPNDNTITTSLFFLSLIVSIILSGTIAQRKSV